jgi:Na+-transporting NADH:ubiquinone oxidoreductase subunit B
MVAVGIIFAVVFGKMAFGGFGRNVFNPAMVGRCFLYIAFPIQMTSTWARPLADPWGGLLSWTPSPDAITSATPLTELKNGTPTPLSDLFFGTIPGSLGETSALLIIGGGIYLLAVKAAPWRIALSCLLGGVITSILLPLAGPGMSASPVANLMSGSFLFGTAFVATEPISGAKTRPGQWIYGFMIGCLTIFLRNFSNFSEGVMFAVLLMNGFVPILDYSVREFQAWRKSDR